MMQINFDPYDMIMQLNARVGLLEGYIKEIQLNQLQISNMLEQQNGLIKRCQENEKSLGEFVAQVLLDQAHKK